MNRYKLLLQKKADLKAEGETLLAVAEPTDEQVARLTALTGELKATNAEIATLEELREEMRMGAGTPAIVPLETADPAPATVAQPTPFRSLGEQLTAVARAAQNPHAIDPRLTEIMSAAAGASEAVLSDGGFLVQTDFQTDLMSETRETSVLFPKADNTEISANSNGLKVNTVDETSRATGSRWGGVQAYWLAEAETKTSSKPKFRQMELNLQKLAAVFYATDELLQDAQALGSIAKTAFKEEFGFMIDEAMLRGTGAGMPLGIIGAPGTISVTKETGQAAATLALQNIVNMYSRMSPRSLARSEWYMNTGLWPSLFGLTFDVGVGGIPAFWPAGGLASAPFGTILGRPINVIEQASALGTVGDIIFADWSQYKTITKGGVQEASSIHVKFLTDETAFRWVVRVDGQPKRNSTTTPFKGTATQSPFVVLETRA